MHRFVLICIFFQILCILIIQSIVLSPIINTSNNCSVQILSKDVTIDKQNSLWNINVSSQIGYHLALNVNHQFGFHPLHPSSITIQIDSNTLTSTGDLDIILSFSVSLTKYFSVLMAIDNIRPNRIYPSCNGPLETGNVVQLLSTATDRHSQLVNGDVSNWNSLETDYLENHWPLIFTIENYPHLSDNYTIFKYTNPETPYIQSCRYNEAMPTDQGLNVYIAGDDNGEIFQISKFDIKYELLPTIHPTLSPSSAPFVMSNTEHPATTGYIDDGSNIIGMQTSERIYIMDSEDTIIGINSLLFVTLSIVLGVLILVLIIWFVKCRISKSRKNGDDGMPATVTKQIHVAASSMVELQFEENVNEHKLMDDNELSGDVSMVNEEEEEFIERDVVITNGIGRVNEMDKNYLSASNTVTTINSKSEGKHRFESPYL